MAASQKQITDALRAQWTKELMNFVSRTDTDVCQTAAGTFMFPIIDATGEDRWVKVSVIIPKAAEENEGTDGYSLAREYELKQQAAEERVRKAAEKSAKAAAKRTKVINDQKI